jgi:uncharacterized protein
MSELNQPASKCTAFHGDRKIASGALADVAIRVKELLDREGSARILIFDDATSELIEVDFRGTPAQVGKRVAALVEAQTPPQTEPAAESRGPGRPRLGVVAREVTLLPRHWEWLASQPGGASVALRKLVEQARKANREIDERRRAQEAAYRFLSAMAGDRPGFEEATRALFAGKEKRFDTEVAPWPRDVRAHAQKLAAPVFAKPGPSHEPPDPETTPRKDGSHDF